MLKRFFYAAALLTALSLASAPADACTTTIVSAGASRTGRPMIWKQRDAGKAFNTIVHVAGEKYSYTALVASLKDPSRAYAGINEVGFAIANNLSYNLRPDSLGTDGVKNGAMMAEALGSCATLDDFAALIDAWPRPMNISSNFSVIDAAGGAAYFEVSDTAYVRYDVPEGGYLVRTNFSFSGDSDRGAGHARYYTMEWQMTRRSSYDAAFFLGVGREFVNIYNGGDLLKHQRSGYFLSRDYIPRPSTAGEVVIEGVNPGERPDSGIMWCVVGNPPCTYAIPVWVAAGARIASPVCGDAPANRLAVKLKHAMSPLGWPGANEYVSVEILRKALSIVRKYEKVELREGAALDRKFRSDGFDAAAVEEYNRGAALRFEAFRKEVAPLISETSER